MPLEFILNWETEFRVRQILWVHACARARVCVCACGNNYVCARMHSVYVFWVVRECSKCSCWSYVNFCLMVCFQFFLVATEQCVPRENFPFYVIFKRAIKFLNSFCDTPRRPLWFSTRGVRVTSPEKKYQLGYGRLQTSLTLDGIWGAGGGGMFPPPASQHQTDKS